ncbi:hypothetical protein FRC17_011026 [Serendipita sp. 399]|nr:hypothetical protein FRC17_011026 [Serendipita sp. 399]
MLRPMATGSPNGRIINANIPHDFVKVVQSDGKLSEKPIKLASLLQSINQSTEFVELVSDRDGAIVKIKSRKEALKQEKDLKERKMANRVVTKQIQVSWVISDGDVQHKLAQARKYLEKGNHVWLVYSSKPGQIPPLAQDCDSLVKKIHTLLDDIASVHRVDRLGKSLTSNTTVQYIPKKPTK